MGTPGLPQALAPSPECARDHSPLPLVPSVPAPWRIPRQGHPPGHGTPGHVEDGRGRGTVGDGTAHSAQGAEREVLRGAVSGEAASSPCPGPVVGCLLGVLGGTPLAGKAVGGPARPGAPSALASGPRSTASAAHLRRGFNRRGGPRQPQDIFSAGFWPLSLSCSLQDLTRLLPLPPNLGATHPAPWPGLRFKEGPPRSHPWFRASEAPR